MGAFAEPVARARQNLPSLRRKKGEPPYAPAQTTDRGNDSPTFSDVSDPRPLPISPGSFPASPGPLVARRRLSLNGRTNECFRLFCVGRPRRKRRKFKVSPTKKGGCREVGGRACLQSQRGSLNIHSQTQVPCRHQCFHFLFIFIFIFPCS